MQCDIMSVCSRDDARGYQLYQSDPSGNYGGWKATAIGANHQGAQNLLKQEYKEDLSLQQAIQLVMKVPQINIVKNTQCAEFYSVVICSPWSFSSMCAFALQEVVCLIAQ